jgi:hypothetical protein
VQPVRRFFRRALAGEERLWALWWLGGIPVAIAATGLTLSAEFVRVDGHHAWGDFLDVIKLLIYAAWFGCIWRAAGNAESRIARTAARLAVAAGVVTAAITV